MWNVEIWKSGCSERPMNQAQLRQRTKQFALRCPRTTARPPKRISKPRSVRKKKKAPRKWRPRFPDFQISRFRNLPDYLRNRLAIDVDLHALARLGHVGGEELLLLLVDHFRAQRVFLFRELVGGDVLTLQDLDDRGAGVGHDRLAHRPLRQ